MKNFPTNHKINCRCVVCKAIRGETKGKEWEQFVGNKKRKQYYCKEKDCNNKVHYNTFLYGQGRCLNCSNKLLSKRKHKENCQCFKCKAIRKKYS